MINQQVSAAINTREMFVNAVLQYVDEIDVKHLVLRVEAYLLLDGFINKIKWRIFITENHHIAVPYIS